MRRTFFIFVICGLLVFALYRYYTLTSERRGPARVPVRYTPAAGPKLEAKDLQVLTALDAEYTRLIDTVVPSVVSVTSSRTLRLVRPQIFDPLDFFLPGRRNRLPREQTERSLGSGVIVSREGHILTNNHVITGMQEIQVQLTDGRVEAAQLIGSDAQTDIAVLKIAAAKLEPLPLGDSDQVRVGQTVFAIGNPFGLQETVTQGIISAKGRRAVSDSGVEFLQTDAAVNQGNSGGPLLNLRGEIIGINSAIYSTSEEGGWLGISFAIPSNTARRTLESLLKSGRVVRGYLGVQMSNLTREAARALRLPDTAGALVLDVVPGSPAEKAGIEAEDVIRTFSGRPITDTLTLRSRLAESDLGATVELEIFRRGQKLTVQAQIAEAPSELGLVPPPQSAPPQNPRANSSGHPLAGINVGEISAALRAALPQNVAGARILSVPPDSPLAAKLQAGDIVEEVNETAIRNSEHFTRMVRALPPAERALLRVIRNGSRSFIIVP